MITFQNKTLSKKIMITILQRKIFEFRNKYRMLALLNGNIIVFLIISLSVIVGSIGNYCLKIRCIKLVQELLFCC